MIRRLEERLMRVTRIVGLLMPLLAAGCAGMDRAPQGEPPRAGTQQEKAVAVKPEPAAPKQDKAPAPQEIAAKQEKVVAGKPVQISPKQEEPAATEAAAPQAAPPVTAPTDHAAMPEAPSKTPPTRAPAAVAPKELAPKKEAVAPPAPKPATLDLTSLEKRLKETNAIGVFTKLTLKNQVDDLLDQFRAYYQGQVKTTLTALRQPYDQLLLKVLSLLQDKDPPLARAIAESREAIWGILSDPVKFKNL